MGRVEEEQCLESLGLMGVVEEEEQRLVESLE